MVENITVERLNATAVITINRPAVMNAVNYQTAVEIREAVSALEDDDDVWTLVLTGAGTRAFSAGADLKAMSEGRSASLEVEGFAGFVRYPRSKPAIAAVNGLALGGGFEIVLACDLVVAADHAQFGLPEVSRGIIPGGGGLIQLGRQLPGPRSAEVAITGKRWSARDAFDAGLVNRVVPGALVMSAALELADEVNLNAPLAVRASLRTLRASRWGSSLEGAWATSQTESKAIRETDDAKEGPLAFVEKREPRWSGR